MQRKTVKQVQVDPNVRCLRVYPTESTRKIIGELETVGIRLSRQDAIHLAGVLLAVTQDWETVDITAFRFRKRRSDGTYPVTVTGIH